MIGSSDSSSPCVKTAINSAPSFAEQMQQPVKGDFPAAGPYQMAVLGEAVGQHPLAQLLGLEVRGEHIHNHRVEEPHCLLSSPARAPSIETRSSPQMRISS
jgi:hypothetical protein